MRVVLASEQFQQFVIPRLHAQTDPVNSEFLQHGCLARGNASRICFGGPLIHLRRVEVLAKAAKQISNLRNIQWGGRPAAKKNRKRNDAAPPEIASPHFLKQPLKKPPCLRPIE